jgi:hypothetical protein
MIRKIRRERLSFCNDLSRPRRGWVHKIASESCNFLNDLVRDGNGLSAQEIDAYVDTSVSHPTGRRALR